MNETNNNRSDLDDLRNALVGKTLYIDSGDDSPHTATIASIDDDGDGIYVQIKQHDDDGFVYCRFLDGGWDDHLLRRLARGSVVALLPARDETITVCSTDAAALPRLWERKQGATLHALLHAYYHTWGDCLAALDSLHRADRPLLAAAEAYTALLRKYIADIARELDMLPKKEQEQDKQ